MLGGREGREVDIDQQLVGRERRAAYAQEEIGQRHVPLTAGAAQRDLRVERPQGRNGVVGRRSREEVTSHCTAVADLWCANFPGGPGQRIGNRNQQG